jgi:hypothetical protein
VNLQKSIEDIAQRTGIPKTEVQKFINYGWTFVETAIDWRFEIVTHFGERAILMDHVLQGIYGVGLKKERAKNDDNNGRVS